MSLSYAIGSRTHAQQQRKEKSSVAKTKQSAAANNCVGVGNSKSNQTKVTATPSTINTPPKPRVVTLANLKQTSADRGKKATKSRTPNKTAAQPAVRTETPKMWDEREKQTLNATGYNSVSLRGDRNASTSSGYATQGRYNEVSSNRLPAGRSRPTDGQPEPDEERQDSYNPHGGYTLVTPNPKKREKLQNQANQELERLAAYKEKKKLGHVSIEPGRVGGSRLSEEQIRRQQQREQENKKYELISKRRQWAEEKKAREDKEYNEKKARAREVAEKNKRREEQRQRDKRSERHRWIEKGGLEKLESVEAKSSGSEDEELGSKESLAGLMEMFPFKSSEKLGEMLKAANGDVNKVIDWLSN